MRKCLFILISRVSRKRVKGMLRAEKLTTPLIKDVKLRILRYSHESGTDSSTEICFSKFMTTYLIAVIHH